MSTGLSIPFKPSPSGGIALSSGDEQDWNVISLALTSDENENSFQQGEGLGQAHIFDINDPEGRASILSRLRRVFDKFERLKRFKLLENTLRWKNDDEGAPQLYFKYIALESDSEKTYTSSYPSGVSGSLSSNSR